MSTRRLAAIIAICIAVITVAAIAAFEHASPYYLTISSTEFGSVTAPGEGTFAYRAGAVVDLVAMADDGCRFVNWSGDVETVANVTAATTTITMTSDHSVTARFVAMYDLTVSSTSGGSVTTPGEGTFTYDAGTAVNIVATPDAGYRFAGWTGQVGAVANVSAASTTISMNNNYFIAANFEKITPRQFALTVSKTVGGWIAAPGEGTFLYDGGTVVDLAARASSGYDFVGWTGDVATIADVNAASTSIVMNDTYSIRANFSRIREETQVSYHTLTVSVTGSGSTIPAVGRHVYAAGTIVSLVARPDPGYRFVRWAGDVGTIDDPKAAATTITVNDNYSIVAKFAVNFLIAAGNQHTVGVRSDGTAVAVGANGSGQCDVGGWSTIVQVAAGYGHTVGLRSDGTVVAAGANGFGQCDVQDWRNIVQVAAGDNHTVGLKSDGTVVATGWNGSGQCDVSSWKGIIEVAAGYEFTIGLKADGTVVAVGANYAGQCNVGDWVDIVHIAAGDDFSVGVRADGSVVAAGGNYAGECDVGNWRDIIQVTTGYRYTVGLKRDGTVLATGRNYSGQCDVGSWRDIVQVAAGDYHTVGLKADGTLVNTWPEIDVGEWDLL